VSAFSSGTGTVTVLQRCLHVLEIELRRLVWRFLPCIVFHCLSAALPRSSRTAVCLTIEPQVPQLLGQSVLSSWGSSRQGVLRASFAEQGHSVWPLGRVRACKAPALRQHELTCCTIVGCCDGSSPSSLTSLCSAICRTGVLAAMPTSRSCRGGPA